MIGWDTPLPPVEPAPPCPGCGADTHKYDGAVWCVGQCGWSDLIGWAINTEETS